MLQYPINVYPDKVAFDSTKSNYDRDLHFTFKGDQLTCIYWRLYNYDTQEIATNNGAPIMETLCNPTLTPLAYNNDVYSAGGVLFQGLPWGRYVLQMMFTETRTSRSNTAFLNSFDRFVSRGKTTAAYTANTSTIDIEDKINVIYEWNKAGNLCSCTTMNVTTSGVTQEVKTSDILMRIGNENVRIDSYDYETGEVTLTNNLQNSYPSGTPYQLYANYLISEMYYFEVSEEPQILALEQSGNDDVWATWDARKGNFKGYFWKNPESFIQDKTNLKYFTVNLQKKQHSSLYWDVNTTDKIYSQDIDWLFVDDYDPEELHGGNYETREYKFIVNYVLQNGMSFTREYSAIQPERDDSYKPPQEGMHCLMTQKDNKVQFFWQGTLDPNIDYRVYRIDAPQLRNPETRQDKLYIDYPMKPRKLLIADSRVNDVVDYTVGQQSRFQYIVVPYDNRLNATTVYEATVSPIFETNFWGYTIIAIKDTGTNYYGRPIYTAGDTWKFMAEIDDTDNQQNLNNVVHVGYGKYATATSTDNDYISGSLTAALGNMNCSTKEFEDDIEVVKAWRRFIAQDCLFILKSQKGDVWLVKITDNTVTKYKEDVSKIPVEFTFSWVECGSVDDILVR